MKQRGLPAKTQPGWGVFGLLLFGLVMGLALIVRGWPGVREILHSASEGSYAVGQNLAAGHWTRRPAGHVSKD